MIWTDVWSKIAHLRNLYEASMAAALFEIRPVYYLKMTFTNNNNNNNNNNNEGNKYE